MQELTPPTPTNMTLQFDEGQMEKLVTAMSVSQVVSIPVPASRQVDTTGVKRVRPSSILDQVKEYLKTNPELKSMSGKKASEWLLKHKQFKVTPQYINKAKKGLN